MLKRINRLLDRLIVWLRVLAWRRRNAAQYRAAIKSHAELSRRHDRNRWRR